MKIAVGAFPTVFLSKKPPVVPETTVAEPARPVEPVVIPMVEKPAV